jgi:hypothetical protein
MRVSRKPFNAGENLPHLRSTFLSDLRDVVVACFCALAGGGSRRKKSSAEPDQQAKQSHANDEAPNNQAFLHRQQGFVRCAF